MEEIKEKEEKKGNPFWFVDMLIFVIRFIIGLMFCYFMTLPITIFLHIFYLDKYGSFFVFTKWDLYLVLISNIIFWIKIYSDDRRLKK